MTWTRADKFLIAGMVLLNLALFYRLGFNSTQGSFVVVEVEQKEVSRVPLSTDKVLHISGKLGETEVEIRDGRTRILRSPCKNKVCIKRDTSATPIEWPPAFPMGWWFGWWVILTGRWTPSLAN